MKRKILIILFYFFIFNTNLYISFSQEQLDPDYITAFGNDLNNTPFKLRADYFNKFNKSWRDATTDEKTEFANKWLKNNTIKEKKSDTGKLKEETTFEVDNRFPEEYGPTLKNAPFEARAQFYKENGTSWYNISTKDRSIFLEKWISKNKGLLEKKLEKQKKFITEKYEENTEENADNKNEIIIPQEYGQDLLNSPFEVRLKYFNEFGNSWRKISYEERRFYIINWLKSNEEIVKREKELQEIKRQQLIKQKEDKDALTDLIKNKKDLLNDRIKAMKKEAKDKDKREKKRKENFKKKIDDKKDLLKELKKRQKEKDKKRKE